MEKFYASLRETSIEVYGKLDIDNELCVDVTLSGGDGGGVHYLTKPQLEELANHLLNVLDEEEK